VRLKIHFDRDSRPCWSLGVWLTLRIFDIAFEEAVPEGLPDPEAASPHAGQPGRPPLLVDRQVTASGPLAIIEYLAERHPAVWPEDRAARARARAVAAELHAGFPGVRSLLSQRTEGDPPHRLVRKPLAVDLIRLQAICTGLRAATSADDGPFLFGRFTAADAMLAPLAGPWLQRQLAHDPVCATYLQVLSNLPALAEWQPGTVRERVDIPVMSPPLRPLSSDPPPPAAEKEPEPAPVTPPPVEAAAIPVRLEDVARPSITYLDEAPSRGWFGLRLGELISTSPPIPPVPTRPATPSGPTREAPPPATVRDAQRIRGRNPADAPDPPKGNDRRASDHPSRAPDPGPMARTAGSQNQSIESGRLMFRLRRPDPTTGGLNGLASRIGQAVSRPATMPAEPREPDKDIEPAGPVPKRPK
jgi:glutathione S-transferase